MAVLGCIADDFTGATDLASMLVEGGMRTLQTIGVPQAPLPEDADAIVVALKSRSIPAEDAVAQSLQALEWLRTAGCRQYFFKYCSTFDSTAKGNIGPVADALMSALGADFTVACPAFPENGRTVYRGYLFVGDVLLNESGMQNHPLTPMRDPNLVRVLQQQTSRHVGLLRYDTIAAGPEQVAARIAALRGEGIGIAIADASTMAICAHWAPAAPACSCSPAALGSRSGCPTTTAATGCCITPARRRSFPRSVAAPWSSPEAARSPPTARWQPGGRPGLPSASRRRRWREENP